MRRGKSNSRAHRVQPVTSGFHAFALAQSAQLEVGANAQSVQPCAVTPMTGPRWSYAWGPINSAAPGPFSRPPAMTDGPPWTDDARWITIRAVVSLVLAWPLAGALMLGSVAAGGPAHGRSLEVADVAPGAAAAVEPGAAPGCADGDGLLRGVSRRLGRDAATAAADAGVAFAVDDSGPPTSPAIEVTFSDRAGRPLGRRLFGLAGSSCPAALDAAAVAVTLFLQDRAAER